MSGVHVRPASYVDWRQLAALYRECFPDEPEGQISAYCREYLHNTEVALIGGQIQGAIIALPRPAEGLMWLQIIAVSRRARRAGLGKQLLARFEQAAAGRGFAKVALATRPWYHAAHRLYEATGYTRLIEPNTGDYRYSKAITPTARPAALPGQREPRLVAKARQVFGRLAYRGLVTLRETGRLSFPPPGTVSVKTPPVSERHGDRIPLVRLGQSPGPRIAGTLSAPLALSHGLCNHPELAQLFRDDQRLRLMVHRMPPHLVEIVPIQGQGAESSGVFGAGEGSMSPADAFDALSERRLRMVLSQAQYYDADVSDLFRALLVDLAAIYKKMQPAVHAASASLVLSAGGFSGPGPRQAGYALVSQVRGSQTLLAGPAGRERELVLTPGRSVLLPAGMPHRVREEDGITVALTVAFHTR